MKVLFLINTLGGGGAERVLVNLVNHMNHEKYEITVKTLFDKGINRKFLCDKVNYETFLKHMPRGNSYVAKLIPAKWMKKAIINDDYDVVIAYLEGIPSKIVSSIEDGKSKKIAWIHIDVNHDKSLSRIFWGEKHIKRSFESFNAIVGVSKSVISAFEERTGIKDTTVVKYNTNDLSSIKAKALEMPDDLRLNQSVKNVYTIGRLVSQKGFDRLLEAHKRLADKGIKYHLYIFGEGEEREKLETYINNNALKDSVFLMGFKENPYKYMSKFDLFVCSSRHEGLSTAMSEAIILGVPVLTTNCAGAEEVVGANSEYGLLTENSTEGIAGGLEKLLKDEALISHYKNRAAERSAFFSIENTVREVEKLIDEVAKS